MKTKSKKGKGIAMTFLTGGFVVLFAGGTYMYTQHQIEPVKAYEFARDVPVNTKIDSSDLKVVNVPKSAVKDNMVLDSGDIVGKYNNTKVFNGEFVIKDNLVKKEDVDPFESIDLTKLRKVTIPANYTSALGGDIKPGDRIDLVYVGEENTDSKDFTYAKTIMTDVLVYATNTDDGFQYVNKAQNVKGQVYEGGDDIDTSGESGGLGSLTLAVSLQQAEEISSRMKTGEIQILGRFADSQDYETAGYVNGDYEKIFSGSGNAETNK
jgi:pilus assembly protein CpaB